MTPVDRLESGLTWSLPWVVCVLAATVQIAVLRPRPSGAAERSQRIVGLPLAGTAPVVDRHRTPPTELPPLRGPSLFDLATSSAAWLELAAGGQVDAASITFRTTAVREALCHQPVDRGDADLDVDVDYPNPAGDEQRQLLVQTRPYRLVPPAAWSVWVWDVRPERPRLVLERHGERQKLTVAHDDEGRAVLVNESLLRRNRVLAWQADGWAEVAPDGAVTHAWRQLLAAFGDLPWWGWLVCALPLVQMLLAGLEAIRELGAVSRQRVTATAESAGLLAGLALLAGALAVVLWLRRDPANDPLTQLLAPVVLGAAVAVPLRLSAWLAGPAPQK